jgi:hypothetical protein
MSNTGLIVRRSARFEISLPARMRVAAYHADVLGFAKGVCGQDRWIDINVIDFGGGGLGFMAEVYLPRLVDLEIEIPNTENPEAEPMLSCQIRVQRVQMTDRRPGYKIGGSYINVEPSVQMQINEMLERLSNDSSIEEEDTHA